MEKSKRTFRGSYPAYALTYFFFYWSLGVFTSVLSMYLTGIGKSKAEMSFIMSASSLFGVVLIPIVGYINDKLRKPRLICTVMMACVAVFGILFALVRETMLLFLLNGCIMGFISSLSPVSERMATSTKYRYGTIRIWGTFGYAAAVQVACAMMEFTSPQLIFVSVSVSAVLAIVGFLGTDDISFTDTEAAKAAAGKQFSFLCAPMYILFVIIGFVFSGCSNLNMTYSPILLQELGMPTGAVGTVLFFSTIVELPVILFSYKFMDRFSGRTLMLLAFAIMVAQFLLYATAPNAPAFSKAAESHSSGVRTGAHSASRCRLPLPKPLQAQSQRDHAAIPGGASFWVWAAGAGLFSEPSSPSGVCAKAVTEKRCPASAS